MKLKYIPYGLARALAQSPPFQQLRIGLAAIVPFREPAVDGGCTGIELMGACFGLIKREDRGARYTLAMGEPEGREVDSTNLTSYSSEFAESSRQPAADSALPRTLEAIAAPVSSTRYCKRSVTLAVLEELLSGRFLTLAEIASLLKRNPSGLRNEFLTPLVKDGHPKLKYPHEPNRPDQAYTVAED